MVEYKVKVYNDRTVWRNLDGKYHREDGPAIECKSGTKLWHNNGNLHREDGPAVERANGTKEWWANDKLHRLDGPAREWPDGTKEWWIDDKEYTEKQFIAYIKKLNKPCAGKKVIVDGIEYELK